MLVGLFGAVGGGRGGRCKLRGRWGQGCRPRFPEGRVSLGGLFLVHCWCGKGRGWFWLQGLGLRSASTHLPPHNHHTAIRRPRNREALPSQLHRRDAAFRPHVPESAGAVGRDGGEFGFFGWVPGHALDARCVAAQLGAVFDLRLFGVPDTQDAVGGAGCDVGACGGPGYGADAGRGGGG